MEKIPKKLAEKQEIQRQKTVNLVMRAIHDLKAEGYEIKIKNLIEYTNLSRSVFSKPHVRKVLAEAGIIKDAEADEIQKKTTKKVTQISNLKEKLLQKEEYIQRLISDNEELAEANALLRGRLYLLMQRQAREENP